jgi:malate dehydrogenase
MKINGAALPSVITDTEWLQGDFIKIIQQRGAAIINARGSSSAASAANAAIDHVKAFLNPTPAGDWFSAAIPSDGSYGIDEGLIFSFPLTSTGNGDYAIVQGLALSDFAKDKIAKTLQELRDEKAVVADLLG